LDDLQELMNVRVIRVSAEAALWSAPLLGHAHRRQAAQLLDDAEQRTNSPRVLAEIDSVRRDLVEAAQEQDGPGEG
jgi:hypothetical protein